MNSRTLSSRPIESYHSVIHHDFTWHTSVERGHVCRVIETEKLQIRLSNIKSQLYRVRNKFSARARAREHERERERSDYCMIETRVRLDKSICWVTGFWGVNTETMDIIKSNIAADSRLRGESCERNDPSSHHHEGFVMHPLGRVRIRRHHALLDTLIRISVKDHDRHTLTSYRVAQNTSAIIRAYISFYSSELLIFLSFFLTCYVI